MLKKVRKVTRKISPLAFLLFTMVTTQLSSYKNVIAKTIE
jgi:hypothetical protein